MFVSIGIRARINVEALNMVESSGNVTRHRSVPVVLPLAPGKYVVRWVPAISGEALAHRYQLELVNLAKSSSECSNRIDYWSEKGEFLKHFDLSFYQKTQSKIQYKQWEINLVTKFQQKQEESGKKKRSRKGEEEKGEEEKKEYTFDDIKEVEKTIVTNSIVEDIGGFLVTMPPTRRTSNVMFSYVVPTYDALESGAAQIDSQFSVRHALTADTVAGEIGYKRQGNTAPVQAPYYVQVASAVYGFTVAINLSGIGVLSTTGEPIDDNVCNADKRREIALDALDPILRLDFGAKRTRYNPHGEVEIALAIIHEKPLMVYPPTLKFDEFIRKTLSLAKSRNATPIAWTPSDAVAKVFETMFKEVFGNNSAVKVEEAIIKDPDPKQFINKLKEKSRVSESKTNAPK